MRSLFSIFGCSDKDIAWFIYDALAIYADSMPVQVLNPVSSLSIVDHLEISHDLPFECQKANWVRSGFLKPRDGFQQDALGDYWHLVQLAVEAWPSRSWKPLDSGSRIVGLHHGWHWLYLCCVLSD